MKLRRITTKDIQYPARITKILGGDAPKYLNLMGNEDLLNSRSIGFSGVRKPEFKMCGEQKSAFTVYYCDEVVRNNYTVVSGGAKGIDSEAHYHALKEGGSTVIVLPYGFDHFTVPRGLEDVWNWERVLVISHFEDFMAFSAPRAFARNDLIIALSQAVIIPESGNLTGGSFGTGKRCLKLKIPLFVPSLGTGNEYLLKHGARELSTDIYPFENDTRIDIDNVFTTIEWSRVFT